MKYFFTFAKKGSVRIPYKNMKNFLGQPLIEHTLKIFSKMYRNFNSAKFFCVSDFSDIETLTKVYSLTKYIDETKLKAKTFNKKVKEVLKNEGIKLTKDDVIILFQPTSPLKNGDKIVKQLKEFTESDYDLAFSTYPLKSSHYYVDNKSVNYSMVERDVKFNEKTVMVESGSYYFFKPDQLKKVYFMNSDNYTLLEDDYNIDLDTIEEWNSTELILRKNN